MNVDIYSLKLHQEEKLNNGDYVMRVPGGWVYSVNNPADDSLHPVFVPFDAEFVADVEAGRSGTREGKKAQMCVRLRALTNAMVGAKDGRYLYNNDLFVISRSFLDEVIAELGG